MRRSAVAASSVAWFVLVGGTFGCLLPYLLNDWHFHRPLPYWVAAQAAGVLLICVGLTRHQLAYWRDTETLMMHALEIDPSNYVAHQNLGVYYAKAGRTEAAREHRQKFRELDPAFRQNSAGPPIL